MTKESGRSQSSTVPFVIVLRRYVQEGHVLPASNHAWKWIVCVQVPNEDLKQSIVRDMASLKRFCTTRSASKVTSLVQLTGDKQIFQKLHQAFAWILKAGGSRLTERLLEGPPTEDSVIDFDRQEGKKHVVFKWVDMIS